MSTFPRSYEEWILTPEQLQLLGKFRCEYFAERSPSEEDGKDRLERSFVGVRSHSSIVEVEGCRLAYEKLSSDPSANIRKDATGVES